MRPDDGGAALASIRFAPVGGMSRAGVERVAAAVSRCVGVPCRVDDFRLDGELRLVPGRPQVDASHLLARLERHPVEAGAVLVGVADIDIALPILTHVFGGARHGGHTAVVSLARLRQEFYGLPADEALLERRAVAEVLHEAAHLAGLLHCARYDCLMHFCPDVESIDLRGLSFCPDCAAALPAGFLPRSAAATATAPTEPNATGLSAPACRPHRKPDRRLR